MAVLEIVLDEPTRTFIAGEQVTGNVVLSRDCNSAGMLMGDASFRFCHFVLTCSCELAVNKNTSFASSSAGNPLNTINNGIDSVLSGGTREPYCLMRQMVDFTEEGKILQVESKLQHQKIVTNSDGNKKQQTFFPFTICLKPSDNVHNGLLDRYVSKAS